MCEIMEEFRSHYRAEGFEQGVACGEKRGKIEGKIEGRIEGKTEGRIEGRFESLCDMTKRIMAGKGKTLEDAMIYLQLTDDEKRSVRRAFGQCSQSAALQRFEAEL